jgi:hypothetical protein
LRGRRMRLAMTCCAKSCWMPLWPLQGPCQQNKLPPALSTANGRRPPHRWAVNTCAKICCPRCMYKNALRSHLSKMGS